MDKFEKLNEFTEGNLSEEQESSLFAELSSDSSLRMELKQLLSVNATVNLNRNNFKVPPVLKASVFSNIGLPLETPGLELPVANGLKSTLSKYKTLISSFVSSAASIIGLLLFLNYTGNIGDGEIKTITKIEKVPVYIESNAEQTNVSDLATKNIEPKIIYLKSEPIIKYIQRENSENLYALHNIKRDNMYSSLPISLANKSNNDNIIQGNNTSKFVPTGNYITDNNSIQTNRSEKSKFTLEWKGAMNWNDPVETVSSAKYSKLTNNSLALSYNLYNNFSFGADIREENFYQEFNFKLDGERVNVKQLPQYTTYSGFARVRFLNSDLFKNFVQISAGANNNGLVYRGMYGIEFTPYEKFGLVFGMEYSSMLFKFDNVGFNANKFSLNYGLIYNF